MRGVTLAARAPDRFGALLVVGFVVQVALQAVLNIAVVTNTIPNTGISLPFFSSGGTSLMMLLGEMGIVLSVSRGKHKGGHFCRKMGCLPRKRRKKQTNDRTNAFCGVRVQREPTALVLHTMGYLWQNGGLCMAGDYIITGGRPLNGTVRVPAAKNSVLPLLAASLLCSGPVRLCGVPELADVAESLALLRSAGCTAERQGADVRVDGVPGSGTLAAGPAGRMRASILFCAPLLARLGRAQTVLPGGCRIGARPIDLHLAGLVQMGACPQLEGERLLLTAPAGLHGADITLRFPSVGATETLLLAAALAQGETTLRGAAREPEIEDLAAFLNRCGGRVQGAGTGTVRVQGVRRLHGCSFAPLPDRITAATFACACAAAGGRVELAGCAPRLYAPVLEILEQMGCGVVRRSDAAVITRFGRLYGPGGCSPGHTRRWPPTRPRCWRRCCSARRDPAASRM